MKKKFPHILVKNHGMLSDEDWKIIEKDEEFDNIRKNQIKAEVEIGKVSTAELSRLAKKGKNLSEARNTDVLSTVARSRFERFLKSAFESIDNCGLFKGKDKPSELDKPKTPNSGENNDSDNSKDNPQDDSEITPQEKV